MLTPFLVFLAFVATAVAITLLLIVLGALVARQSHEYAASRRTR